MSIGRVKTNLTTIEEGVGLAGYTKVWLMKYVVPAVFLCGLLLAASVVRLSFLTARDWVSPCGVWIEYYQDADYTHRKAIRPLRELSAFYPQYLPRGVRLQNMYARIEGWLNVPSKGEYSFATLSEDGIRLYVDGSLLINNWTNQSFYGSGKCIDGVALLPGLHSLRVDYYNGENTGRFRVEWLGPSIPPRTTIAVPHLRKKKR